MTEQERQQAEAARAAGAAIVGLVNVGVLPPEHRIEAALVLTPKGDTAARDAILEAIG